MRDRGSSPLLIVWKVRGSWTGADTSDSSQGGHTIICPAPGFIVIRAARLIALKAIQCDLVGRGARVDGSFFARGLFARQQPR